MDIKNRVTPAICWLMLALLCYFSLYHQLQKLPVNLWDESWYALNAIEMIENGKFLEVFLLGNPDVGNSKPPLALWCMIPFIKLFGFNELGIRLASATFSLFSAALLYLSAVRIFKDRIRALIVPMILISSVGFVSTHTARTGDTDSIIAFWICAQCLCFYYYVSSGEKKEQTVALILLSLCVACGCLTKGIAGFLALPGFVAWILIRKKIRSIITDKGFYIGIMVFIILVPGYYLLREKLTPGYLDAVWTAEIGGRLKVQEFLNEKPLPFYYYYREMLLNQRLLGWIFVLPLSVLIILKVDKSPVKTFGLVFITGLLSVSILLGMSKTKTPWYDSSLYPLIAAVTGTGIFLFIKNKPYAWFAATILLFFVQPYLIIINTNTTSKPYTSYPSFLKHLRHAGHQNDTIYIINADYNYAIHFYAKQDALSGHFNKVVFPDSDELKPGKLILTEKAERRIDVNNRFVLEPIAEERQCSFYKIISTR